MITTTGLIYTPWKTVADCNNQISKESIIFDYHGSMMTDPVSDNISFYQPISSAYSFGKFLLTPPPPDNEVEKKIIINELLELANIKILIADERIQKSFGGVIKFDSVQMEKIQLFEKMGVFLAPLVNGCINNGDIEKYKEKKIIFFIIHKGVINKSGGKKFLNKIETMFPHIIVVSGAGEPREFLKNSNAKYASINIIEKCINSMDKYALIQLLFSIRRIRRIKNE